MSTVYRLTLLLIVVALLSAGCSSGAVKPTALPTSAPTPTIQPPTSVTQSVAPLVPPAAVPYQLVSEESLLAFLSDLTAIQPYSGWRNTASSGEAEALDYVQNKLGKFATLNERGLALERQSFNVYLGTELRDAQLTLTINDHEIEVPAEGLRGARYDWQLATYFDTDGILNDANPDPQTAAGAPLFVRDDDTLYTLNADDLKDRVLFIDFALMDSFTNSFALTNGSQLVALINQGLAGVIIVTQYTNKPGESRGTVLGDGAYFQNDTPFVRVPILHVRIEDLSPAGIATWEDLEKIRSARLTLDADVFRPGQSGNLIARIPGANSSQAVILGAHIDSPNGPGAFDDGSGAAALLEVARVLDISKIQPPVDVYLAWFGGHEIGTYGSAYFAATHQPLLDQTLAMVQMDGLGYPLEGRLSKITMLLTSYGRFGDERLPLPDFLSKTVAGQGLSLDQMVEYGLIADNSNFDIFNVPNVYLGYMNTNELRIKGMGYIHYSNHWHDPYETVELAREVGDAFVGMTQVMLAAALEIGHARPILRVPPTPTRRALILAGHTTSISVPTIMLRELGMALAHEGFDVDLILDSQALTQADLADVDVIILPPTLDFPGENLGKWSEAEIGLLDAYVAEGGGLVVVNSAYNHVMKRRLDDHNEDKRVFNALLEPMGITFTFGVSQGDGLALAIAEHPLTENATYLACYDGNAVPFRMENGLELIRYAGSPLVRFVEYGDQGGQVLVIADIGILQADSNGAKNFEFLKNIAHYASSR